MGLREGRFFVASSYAFIGVLKERTVLFPLTASNGLLTQAAAVAAPLLLLLLLLLQGSTNTEPVQHLSCMQLSLDGTMQQSWLNLLTHILPHTVSLAWYPYSVPGLSCFLLFKLVTSASGAVLQQFYEIYSKGQRGWPSNLSCDRYLLRVPPPSPQQCFVLADYCNCILQNLNYSL